MSVLCVYVTLISRRRPGLSTSANQDRTPTKIHKISNRYFRTLNVHTQHTTPHPNLPKLNPTGRASDPNTANPATNPEHS